MTTIQEAVPFPEGAAATVRKWADFFFYQPAIDTLDLVKDMIGHPDNVQRAVSAWEASAKHMQDSSRSVATARGDVDTYWTGGAAMGFADYVTEVDKKVTANVTALQTAAKETATLYSTLINMYKSCVNYILDCAKALSNFIGGALGDWKTYLGGLAEATGVGAPAGFALQASHFTGLLSSMVDNVKNVIDNAMDAHSDQIKALNNVSATVVAIAPPGNSSVGLKDPKAWTRR
ncbi:WXG100 family type VII secretion target [Actinomadura sp. NTSP31]|uniref:WXG100 family type VII secretion target n=1 Tax=Actinomadura sp. NTSP31 TaxID=1735447 RepID=UPI0035C21665